MRWGYTNGRRNGKRVAVGVTTKEGEYITNPKYVHDLDTSVFGNVSRVPSQKEFQDALQSGGQVWYSPEHQHYSTTSKRRYNNELTNGSTENHKFYKELYDQWHNADAGKKLVSKWLNSSKSKKKR